MEHFTADESKKDIGQLVGHIPTDNNTTEGTA